MLAESLTTLYDPKINGVKNNSQVLLLRKQFNDEMDEVLVVILQMHSSQVPLTIALLGPDRTRETLRTIEIVLPLTHAKKNINPTLIHSWVDPIDFTS